MSHTWSENSLATSHTHQPLRVSAAIFQNLKAVPFLTPTVQWWVTFNNMLKKCNLQVKVVNISNVRGYISGWATSRVLPENTSTIWVNSWAWELRWTMKKKHVPSHCLIWTGNIINIFDWLHKSENLGVQISNTKMHTIWLRERSWIYINNIYQPVTKHDIWEDHISFPLKSSHVLGG